MGHFVEVCRRRVLKVHSGKSNVMVMNGEKGLECEVHGDGILLEHVLEFKYLRCVLDESDTDGSECSRRVTSAIRYLVNARDFQFEYARVLHVTFLVSVLMYGSETML